MFQLNRTVDCMLAVAELRDAAAGRRQWPHPTIMGTRWYIVDRTPTPNIAAPANPEKGSIRRTPIGILLYRTREAKKGCTWGPTGPSYHYYLWVVGDPCGARGVGVHGMHTETLSSQARKQGQGNMFPGDGMY
jgi:hypothetical protein